MGLKNHIKFFQVPLRLIILSMTIFICENAIAQNEIEGVWKSQSEGYMIKISSLGSTYQARIVWLENEKDSRGNIRLDEKNPNEKFRKLPIKGLKILTGLSYDGSKNKWVNGEIYLPDEGKYYTCSATISGNSLSLNMEHKSGSSTKWNLTRQH